MACTPFPNQLLEYLAEGARIGQRPRVELDYSDPEEIRDLSDQLTKDKRADLANVGITRTDTSGRWPARVTPQIPRPRNAAPPPARTSDTFGSTASQLGVLVLRLQYSDKLPRQPLSSAQHHPPSFEPPRGRLPITNLANRSHHSTDPGEEEFEQILEPEQLFA